MSQSISKINVSPSQPNVLSLLDFCKGLAIAWIFLFHYKGSWFGWQGVHIFIILSGFGLTYSCLKNQKPILWKRWYLRRFERILPVYWLVSLLGFIILAASHLSESRGVESHLLQNLVLDLALLRDFSYQTVNSYPAPQLWFIPFIVGFYLIFPYLYSYIAKCKTTRSYLLLLLAVAAIEFIYRAIALYFLDGRPHGDVPLPSLPFIPNLPLDQLPAQVPFQLSAPFSLFPSRIAEFVLGMIGASWLFQNKQKFNHIFSTWVAIIGLFVWLIGNSLLYTGLWGWIFSDFAITLGLSLWLIKLASILQQKASFIFAKISALGSWSYYIFLTHFVFVHAVDKIEEKLNGSNLTKALVSEVFLLGLMIVATFSASWLLMQFDKSKYPRWMMQKSIANFIR